MTLKPWRSSSRGIAQGVVAADGDQVVEAEGLDVLQHLRLVTSKTVEVTPFLVISFVGNSCPSSTGGSFFILEGLVRELCRIGAAGAVDGAGVLAIQRQDVAGAAGRILQVDVGQAFPAAADADDFAADFAATVDHRLDHGIQTRDVAAARENTDTLRSHECSSSLIRLLSDWKISL